MLPFSRKIRFVFSIEPVVSGGGNLSRMLFNRPQLSTWSSFRYDQFGQRHHLHVQEKLDIVSLEKLKYSRLKWKKIQFLVITATFKALMSSQHAISCLKIFETSIMVKKSCISLTCETCNFFYFICCWDWRNDYCSLSGMHNKKKSDGLEFFALFLMLQSPYL